MLQITVHEKTYLLAAETSMDDTKQAVLDAMRGAPAFLSLQQATGGRVEVLLTSASSVVLEQHDDAAVPVLPDDGTEEPDLDDLYGFDYG